MGMSTKPPQSRKELDREDQFVGAKVAVDEMTVDRRVRTVPVRLTESEYSALQQHATEQDRSLSWAARKIIASALDAA
jgi:hypothetical protein